MCVNDGNGRYPSCLEAKYGGSGCENADLCEECRRDVDEILRGHFKGPKGATNDNNETKEFFSVYRRGRNRVMAKLEQAWKIASRLGWKPEEFFMLRERVDLSGLVGLFDADDEIVSVTEAAVEIRNAGGVSQMYYKNDYPHPWLKKVEISEGTGKP